MKTNWEVCNVNRPMNGVSMSKERSMEINAQGMPGMGEGNPKGGLIMLTAAHRKSRTKGIGGAR